MANFSITNDKSKLDVDMIHRFLSTEAYWCKGVPLHTVKASVEHSLTFAVMEDDKQVGFARVISDYATVAYLGDVFILPGHRGKGLSKLLMQAIMEHPNLQGLRRWILLTGDAHGLYRQFGWKDIADPARWMEVHNRNVYSNL